MNGRIGQMGRGERAAVRGIAWIAAVLGAGLVLGVLLQSVAQARVTGPVMLHAGVQALVVGEVNSGVDGISYSGDGATVAFTFPFGVLSTAQVRVVLRTTATGAEALQTLNSDYTLADDDSDGDYTDGPGGTVTFVTAPAATQQVWITRAPVLTQARNLDGTSYVRLNVIEDAIDNLTYEVQYLRRLLWRVPMIPETEAQVGDMNLPASVDRASSWYGWDANGNPTTGSNTTTTLTAAWTAIVQALATGAQQITGLGNLGVDANQIPVLQGSPTDAERRTWKGDEHLDHLYDVRDFANNVQTALDAAHTAGGGTVYLPRGTYSSATSLTLPSGVSLIGDGNSTVVQYTGHDDALVDDTTYFSRLENFCLATTQTDANGIRAGNACRENHWRNLVVYTTASTDNAGIGIYLKAGTGWSGLLGIQNVAVSGFKHGIKVEGGAGNNDWTTIDCTRVSLAGGSPYDPGDADGKIDGSTGFSFDAATNGVATEFRGGTIEGFETGVLHANGGYGGNFYCNFEGNTTNWSVGASFTGEIYNRNSGEYYRATANSTSNIYEREWRKWGVRRRVNYYHDTLEFPNFNDGVPRVWGAYDGTTASFIDGGTPTFAGGFIISGSDTTASQIGLWGHRITWGAGAAPTSGTWNRGDICFNTSAYAYSIPYWVCDTSGTLGTLAGVTADTTASSADIVVNSASNLAVGQYITIAGVTGIKKIANLVGTTVTVDSVCDATVNDGAVAWSAAAWTAVAAPMIVGHSYGSGTTAWTMTASEAAGSFFTPTLAGGAADAVFPAAVAGKQFTVYNNSGGAITFKVTGQTGAAATNGKYSIWVMNATDCVKVYEQP